MLGRFRLPFRRLEKGKASLEIIARVCEIVGKSKVSGSMVSDKALPPIQTRLIQSDSPMSGWSCLFPRQSFPMDGETRVSCIISLVSDCNYELCSLLASSSPGIIVPSSLIAYPSARPSGSFSSGNWLPLMIT